jgi:hypothetical protein
MLRSPQRHRTDLIIAQATTNFAAPDTQSQSFFYSCFVSDLHCINSLHAQPNRLGGNFRRQERSPLRCSTHRPQPNAGWTVRAGAPSFEPCHYVRGVRSGRATPSISSGWRPNSLASQVYPTPRRSDPTATSAPSCWPQFARGATGAPAATKRRPTRIRSRRPAGA